MLCPFFCPKIFFSIRSSARYFHPTTSRCRTGDRAVFELFFPFAAISHRFSYSNMCVCTTTPCIPPPCIPPCLPPCLPQEVLFLEVCFLKFVFLPSSLISEDVIYGTFKNFPSKGRNLENVLLASIGPKVLVGQHLYRRCC